MNLNTDNMTRIDAFNLLLPRRAQFRLGTEAGGFKSKILFNDYQLFFEETKAAANRLYEATGLVP